MNILTIDWEDWFNIIGSDLNQDSNKWEKQDTCLHEITNKLLDYLDEKKIKITFFVVADLARNYQFLIREIAMRGHEIASHSKTHRDHTKMSKIDLRTEIHDSKKILEDIIGSKVSGYRAPGFTISSERRGFFYSELSSADYNYDSSWLIRSFDYRDFLSSYSAFRVTGSMIHVFPVNGFLPLGGGYFRFTPKLLLQLSKPDHRLMYLHPKEFYYQEFLNLRVQNFKDKFMIGDSYEKLDVVLKKSIGLDMRLKNKC